MRPRGAPGPGPRLGRGRGPGEAGERGGSRYGHEVPRAAARRLEWHPPPPPPVPVAARGLGHGAGGRAGRGAAEARGALGPVRRHRQALRSPEVLFVSLVVEVGVRPLAVVPRHLPRRHALPRLLRLHRQHLRARGRRDAGSAGHARELPVLVVPRKRHAHTCCRANCGDPEGRVHRAVRPAAPRVRWHVGLLLRRVPSVRRCPPHSARAARALGPGRRAVAGFPSRRDHVLAVPDVKVPHLVLNPAERWQRAHAEPCKAVELPDHSKSRPQAGGLSLSKRGALEEHALRLHGQSDELLNEATHLGCLEVGLPSRLVDNSPAPLPIQMLHAHPNGGWD
mmetsp:Transcript_23142/g.72218  ORF Transcript_23142/g.72218 Transcript_23142/m.72218 type:complete len:338 (-) Transcript_23142:22-1035(-)